MQIESLEKQIRRLLVDKKSPEQIGAFLNDRIRMTTLSHVLSEQDIETAFSFLFRSGLLTELFQVASSLLDQQRKIPWRFINAAIAEIAPELSQELLAASTQHGFRVANKTRSEIEHALATDRERLVNDIEICKTEGLAQEEKKLLELFFARFPKDPLTKKFREDFQGRNAFAIIQKYPKPSDGQNIKKNLLPALDPELEIIQSSISESLSAQANNEDSIIALLMLGQLDKAISVCESLSETPQKYWLLSELYIQSKRWVDLLALCDSIFEKQQADDPQTIYAVYYLRARALWGLNKKEDAQQLLRELVNVQPEYRNSSSLLVEWENKITGVESL